MKEKILTDIGENYEYVRTIVNNKIEIFKIDLAQNTSKIIGFIVLALFLLGMLGLIISSLVVVLAVYLSSLFDSLIVGILTASFVIIIISVVVFTFRRQIIFTPVAKIFYSKIADKL